MLGYMLLHFSLCFSIFLMDFLKGTYAKEELAYLGI